MNPGQQATLVDSDTVKRYFLDVLDRRLLALRVLVSLSSQNVGFDRGFSRGRTDVDNTIRSTACGRSASRRNVPRRLRGSTRIFVFAVLTLPTR